MRAFTFEAAHAFGDFERVAGGFTRGFVHGAQSHTGTHPERVADANHALCELMRLLLGLHEGAAAVFHVEHEAVKALGEFFAHDARRDERDARHGAGDIAQRVEFLVRRADAAGLANHDAADLVDDMVDFDFVELRAEAGDAFELVECAASDAEAAAGDHRHPDAVAGEQRREHERGFVANAAGAVLVHAHGIVRVPSEHGAAVEHRVGERGGFLRRHALEEDGHRQRAHLILRHVPTREGSDDGVDFLIAEDATVALALDEGRDVHGAS